MNEKIPGDINRGSAILTAARPKKLCQASGSVPIIVFCGLIFISMKMPSFSAGIGGFRGKRKIAGSFGDTP